MRIRLNIRFQVNSGHAKKKRGTSTNARKDITSWRNGKQRGSRRKQGRENMEKLTEDVRTYGAK